MNIAIFDTETIDLKKPFCYNVGYIIRNTDTNEIVVKHDFVVREVWNNKMLFNTAYYADKQPIYVSRMKGRTTDKRKWTEVVEIMETEFKQFGVQHAYAYNSGFDERVFEFNCEWFKTTNPLETIAVHDIRALAMATICTETDYTDFCENYELFTDSGNYSTTAEALCRYIWNNPDAEEEHTALCDSEWENEILATIQQNYNIDIFVDHSCSKSLARMVERELVVVDMGGIHHHFAYRKRTSRKNTIVLG